MQRLMMGVSGPKEREILQGLRSVSLFPAAPLEKLKVNHKKIEPIPEDWLEQRLAEGFMFQARWPGKNTFLSWKPGDIVRSQFFADRLSVEEIFDKLRNIPFELASFGSVFSGGWRDPSAADSEYRPPGFANLHYSHGWACAFKGEGHKRLVSRRWLDYGPWRLNRDEESDFSFVQFHDLEADAETALEQARPGHMRMGISMSGGFIQSSYVTPHALPEKGHYVPERRIVEFVMTGTTPNERALFEAALVRYHADNAFNEETGPVNNVSFVFLLEEDARACLHDLWLRGFECWAVIKGQRVRLDDTYEPPPPVKPQWVLDVEAREAAKG